VDIVLLACTHYPALRAASEQAVGPKALIVDPANAASVMVRRILLERAGGRSIKRARDAFFVTDSPKSFRQASIVFSGLAVGRVNKVAL
jgi:glutamate racemase